MTVKTFIKFKISSHELCIHQKNPQKKYHGFHKNMKQLFSNTDNNKKYFLSSKSAY